MKSYQQTVDWLMDKLPMFQRTGTVAYKKNLNNIIELTEYLGNPQNNYPKIHVAGTNGKGSTCHMLASIFQEAGYKTGLTTSPHLQDFRERIRVNGKICNEKYIVEFVENYGEKIEGMKTSFFEVSIAMAFDYFTQENVDISVIETGLGGRLDSTNIIIPEISVITNIGLDHTHILGNTIEEIAYEKGGIIKEGIPVIIGEADENLRKIFTEISKERGSEIFFAEDESYTFYNSDLKGFYQKKNQKTVLKTIEILRKKGWEISDEAIKKGLENVIENTGLRGRWEILQNHPLIIADTAHNVHGLRETLRQINETPYKNLHFVLGFVNDKDVSSILNLFPKDAKFYFSEPDIPRKLKMEDLRNMVPTGLNSTYHETIQHALNTAKKNAEKEDLIYVGGSTFVVTEVI